MSTQDVRWIQRYKHFVRAFTQLEQAVALSHSRSLSELEKQGLIQAFENTHELAWNTLKDFLEERGVRKLYGSKDSTREAFKQGLIEAGEIWMDMITSRNLSSHTYNQDLADEIVRKIIERYFAEFKRLVHRMQAIIDGDIL